MEPVLGLGKRKSRSRRESPAFFMFDISPRAPRVVAMIDRKYEEEMLNY
jgi:hypothetical protein